MTYEDYVAKLDELPHGKLGFTIARMPYCPGYTYHVYRGRWEGYAYPLYSVVDAIEQMARQFNLDKSEFIRPSWWTDELEALWVSARDTFAHH